MSRAWIAFYMGDYDKDTHALSTLEHGVYFLLLKQCWVHGSIPTEPAKRANIAKMTLREWNKIAPTINPFFNEDGTQKRATKEIEKAEVIRTKRALAGAKGGVNSGRSKAIQKGRQSKFEANAYQTDRQPTYQNGSPAEPSHNSKILNTSSVTAREGVDKTQLVRGSLATELPMGALREPLSGETNRLVASLERLKAAKEATAAPADPVAQGKVWVDRGTPEWNAHEHRAKSLNMRMRLPITRVDENGVERVGAYFDQAMPDGYDCATGERIAPADQEENAA